MVVRALPTATAVVPATVPPRMVQRQHQRGVVVGFRSLMTATITIGIVMTQLRYISIHYQLQLFVQPHSPYHTIYDHDQHVVHTTTNGDFDSSVRSQLLPLRVVDCPLVVSPLRNGTNVTGSSYSTSFCASKESNTNSDPPPPPATVVTKYGFGACLMVKDDNDLLYEWIAYHYTVLSLRYLVIGCDIGGIQNVSLVVNRWRDANFVGPQQQLHIWILQPHDFMYRHQLQQQQQPLNQYRRDSTVTSSNDGTDWKEYFHHALIDRQKGFITVCSELLKTNRVTWTLYIDSDEFVVWNPLSDDDDNERQTQLQRTTTTGDVRKQQQSMSNRSYEIRKKFAGLKSMNTDSSSKTPDYYNLIQQLQQQRDISECYTMPRLLVGALENRTCPEQYRVHEVQETARSQFGPDRFMHMSTLRYFQHAKKGDFSRSKYGKVMMDLSTIDDATIQSNPPRNIHRPYPNHCRAAGGVYFPDAYFFILHYIGSWERYMSRGANDLRRNRLEWESRAYVDDDPNMSACDSTVHHWLLRFQRLVNSDDQVKYLLGAPGLPK